MTPGWHTDLIFQIDQEQDSLIDSLQQVKLIKLNQIFVVKVDLNHKRAWVVSS